MKHLSEEDLILIYYGEPGAPEGAHAHLADCRQCKDAADSLAQTLNLCDEWTVPEPDAGFERRVWDYPPRRRFTPRVWMGVAASVVLLAGAFWLGRQSSVPQTASSEQTSVLAGLSGQAR